MSARKLKVIVTRKLPDPVETRMCELFDTQLNVTDKPLTADELVEAMSQADVLVPTITDRIDSRLLSRSGDRLKLIANFGAGVDNIDVATANARGIIVTNTPGVLTEDTADLTMTLIMAASRRIVEGAEVVKAGGFHGWSPTWMLGRRLWGKRLGIIGMGRIGQAVARRAKAFGMQVHYHNRKPVSPRIAEEVGATYWESLDQMLARMDFISVNCPHTPATYHLLSARRLKLLRPQSIIVNTARGEVIDEGALANMLARGEIAGAGLDVYEHEPAINPKLLKLPNVVLLPHMGSATVEGRIDMGEKVIVNVKTFMDGHRPPDRVIPSMLIKRQAEERSAFVMIFDTAQLSAPPVAVPVGDCEVRRVEWANNDRLLIWVSLDKDKDGETTGVHWKGEILKRSTRRIIAVDRDGKNQVLLFGNQDNSLKLIRELSTVVDFTTDDPRAILMQAWNVQYRVNALYKVDIYTGVATLMETGAKETDDWTTQAGVPVLRFDSNRFTTSVYTRAPGTKGWRFFRKFYRKESKKLDDIDFVGSTTEPGILLAIAADEGEDMLSVRKFDVTTLKMGELVAKRPNRDMDGCFTDRDRNLIASSWTDDRLNYVFTDPDMAKHYRGVCKYFANDCNLALRDISADHSKIVFYASGPKHAGSYWIYDKLKTKLEPLGAAYSGLAGTRLAGMEAISLTSRDGLPLSAYLTTPAQVGAKTPLVVFPHGGPEARDAYDFDPFVQALAAQGWMVLQVNFRGSTGYGRTFFKAGHKHWGDLMQNDVEDALKVVLDRGGVDESRVAICGVSYGGYAALMGAVKTPDRYKAVVSIAGDANLSRTLAFSRRSSDTPDRPRSAPCGSRRPGRRRSAGGRPAIRRRR
jgi:glyoxylate reductase